jgi:SAM-dependent methyltransferase
MFNARPMFVMLLWGSCLNATSEKLIIDYSAEPSFERPVSQLATQLQFNSPDFLFWTSELHETFHYHRKLWEYCYIVQVLHQQGMLRSDKKGLGFGVGLEPLPALFAKYGCQVVASDQDFAAAVTQGWANTGQHAQQKTMLNSRGICETQQFDLLVDLQSIDMTKIDRSLFGQFDFVWSSCSLEHLGSLKAGMDFIKTSIQCLKPGGIAVHTTEYNLSSNTKTLKEGATVIYRRKDIIQLAKELIQMGFEIAVLNFSPGNGEFDRYIDLPPYKSNPHLKLQLEKYVSTSIGLVIRRPN